MTLEATTKDMSLSLHIIQYNNQCYIKKVFIMKTFSVFVESMRRLYRDGKVTKEKICELYESGKIKEEEKSYILNAL